MSGEIEKHGEYAAEPAFPAEAMGGGIDLARYGRRHVITVPATLPPGKAGELDPELGDVRRGRPCG